MLLNVQDIIIHSISPFLSLSDIARLVCVSTKFARIRNLLFRKVTTVVVPEILPQNFMDRSLIAEFILKLVIVCPNINTITIPDEMDLRSDVVLALNKLPIKSFNCNCTPYYYFYSNEDSLVTTTFERNKFNWPLLETLNVPNIAKFLKSD